MVPSTSTATDLSTRRAFANPPPAAVPATPAAPALDVAAQQVTNSNVCLALHVTNPHFSSFSLLLIQCYNNCSNGCYNIIIKTMDNLRNDMASQAMALRFSELSGMNIEWSGKCLVENR